MWISVNVTSIDAIRAPMLNSDCVRFKTLINKIKRTSKQICVQSFIYKTFVQEKSSLFWPLIPKPLQAYMVKNKLKIYELSLTYLTDKTEAIWNVSP